MKFDLCSWKIAIMPLTDASARLVVAGTFDVHLEVAIQTGVLICCVRF